MELPRSIGGGRRRKMRFVIVVAHTQTATIDGISAAGANPEEMLHTPGGDLEILTYGEPIQAPVVPVTPTGIPTPAVVTRAVHELLDFDFLAIDAGIAKPTATPTVTLGEGPGEDIRESIPVPNAGDLYERGRELGRALPDDELVIGEAIPGGTTTALGVLTALGERPTVSSSLPENPLSLKHEVVAEALAVSGLEEGDTAGDPVESVRLMGDPMLATVAGLTVGALETGTEVTLGGGTQLATAAALVRHAGVEEPLTLATTSFVAEDESANIRQLTDDLDVNLRATDPGFEGRNHPAMDAYAAGVVKEGVGMGGALGIADRNGVAMADVRDRFRSVYDRLTADLALEV